MVHDRRGTLAEVSQNEAIEDRNIVHKVAMHGIYLELLQPGLFGSVVSLGVIDLALKRVLQIEFAEHGEKNDLE